MGLPPQKPGLIETPYSRRDTTMNAPTSCAGKTHALDPLDWDATVANWRELHRLEVDHPFGSTEPRDPRKGEIEADYHEAYQRGQSALEAIIKTPAPTIAAIADKLALLVEDVPDPDNAHLAVLKTIEDDCRRLAATWSGDDRVITEAFAKWQAAHRERSALPDGKDIDEQERPFWNISDAAEELIRSTDATTPAGIAAKLWIALEHEMALQADSRLARAADVSAFADDSGQDWTVRLILSALRSLKAMGA